MQITKFGQCCLLIEVSGKRILTDPGRFSVAQNEVRDLDIILITHEHADHLHSESLTEIIKNNPQAKVITNESVGKILTELGVVYEVLPDTTPTECCGVMVEAFPGKHVEIFEEVGQVQNIGFFVAEQLFYPGDAYIQPHKLVPVLALPVAGPWCKAADAIKYAIAVNPQKAFPVHDAVLNEEGLKLTHGIFKTQLAAKGIDFVPMQSNEVIDFN
ncbi:MBL fold metallo-hydrolase [Patescibacteria group bacterium]|nr:MBL fold metallo-hydrolase [Patescibacteria group bacterium]